MRFRIAAWAGLGVLVAAFWAAYIGPFTRFEQPVMWLLAQATCPLAFASLHFHFGVRLYWVLLSNAAVYALAGMTVDMVVRHAKAAGHLSWSL